jgi:hypothetical protein
VIPERISSLIPRVTQQEITEYDKQVERQKSVTPLLSVQSSVSDYLEEKFKECKYDLAASLARLAAIALAVCRGNIKLGLFSLDSAMLQPATSLTRHMCCPLGSLCRPRASI